MEPAQVQATVAQHMSQLQTLVTTGQMTPQQAMARYNALQQALQAYHAERAASGAASGAAPGAPSPVPGGAPGVRPWPAAAPGGAPPQAPSWTGAPTPAPEAAAAKPGTPGAPEAGKPPMPPGVPTVEQLHANPAAQQALQLIQRGGLNPTQYSIALAIVRSALGQAPGAAPGAAAPAAPGAGATAGCAAAPAHGPTDASPAARAASVSTPPVATPPVAPDTRASPRASAPPAAPPARDTTYEIAYLPWHTRLGTYGGRDLDRIDRELVPRLAAYTQPRSVHELGTVDVHALTMSLESGLAHEVAYALNTLLILSAGVQAPPTFSVPLAACDRLLDVLLDVLLEHAFARPAADVLADVARAEEARDAEALQAAGVLCEAMPTYCTSIELALQDAAALRTFRRTAPPPHTPAGAAQRAERDADRRVSVALTTLVVLRNVSCDARWWDGDAAPPAATEALGVFSLAEVLQIRKDVLTIVLGVAGEALDLQTHAPLTAATLLDVQRFFVLDADEFEARYGASPLTLERLAAGRDAGGVNVQALMYQVPHHARLALQALSCFALPDANREVLAQLVPSTVLVQLAHALVAMMPVDLADFRRLSSASRLEYVETAATCLFNVVYLAPPAVKYALRDAPGVPRALFRAARRLLQSAPDYARNPYGVLCRRLIETLALLSEGEDVFGSAPLQGMYWPAPGDRDTHAPPGDTSRRRMRSGLLVEEDDAVLDLLIRTPSVEASVADELLALVSVP
ncbi:hypothetical protein CBS14141_000667 [Malassezia furfur]|nr:hypothetical protein CBS14141_000667 [Malassezia furfur]